jgi:hypothetical protein
MVLRLLQDLAYQVRKSGFQLTILACALSGIIASHILRRKREVLTLLFGYFVLFLFLGVPIAICLGLATLATIICADTLPINYIAQIPSPPSTACPSWPSLSLSRGECSWAPEAFRSVSWRWRTTCSEVCPAASLWPASEQACFRGHQRIRSGHSGSHRHAHDSRHDRTWL